MPRSLRQRMSTSTAARTIAPDRHAVRAQAAMSRAPAAVSRAQAAMSRAQLAVNQAQPAMSRAQPAVSRAQPAVSRAPSPAAAAMRAASARRRLRNRAPATRFCQNPIGAVRRGAGDRDLIRTRSEALTRAPAWRSIRPLRLSSSRSAWLPVRQDVVCDHVVVASSERGAKSAGSLLVRSMTPPSEDQDLAAAQGHGAGEGR
jgi:hypothetical protein